MGDRISNRLAEIRNSLFGLGDLKRAIARHIWIQAFSDDLLAIRHGGFRIRQAGMEEGLIALGEAIQLTDQAEQLFLAQLRSSGFNG
jgi:hypothetical protein